MMRVNAFKNSLIDHCRGSIDTHHVHPAACEMNRVIPGAASQIQHVLTGREQTIEHLPHLLALRTPIRRFAPQGSIGGGDLFERGCHASISWAGSLNPRGAAAMRNSSAAIVPRSNSSAKWK